LGQTLIIENRPGAGGTVGTNYAARLPADGYSMVFASTPNFAINIALYGAVAGDVARDFTSVALFCTAPNVLLTTPDFPGHSFSEFLKIAKQPGGKLFVTTATAGGSGHLAGALLETLTGAQFEYVPHTNPILPLLSGHVQVGLYTLPAALPYLRSGKLKALAVTSITRNASAPEIPTVAEMGFPDFEAVAWYGFAVPTGTPELAIRKLSESVRKAVAQPRVRDKLISLGNDIRPMDAKEFTAFLDVERKKWAEMVRRTGAKPDS
jgi:tripartite-type tricarboxylate transporter receptor subunit TctC